MVAVKPNGVSTDEVERSRSAPAIETIVDNERDMPRGSSQPPPTPTFIQKIGPTTVLTLIGGLIGAAVGWGVASQTITQLQGQVRSLQTDVKVLTRAQIDTDRDVAAMHQWMIDHGVKLATPPPPPATNQLQPGDQ